MRVYAFGVFVLDVEDRRLVREGTPVHLPPKVFDTLVLLVEAQGRAVRREAFFERLWPDVVVEERNLTVNVSSLRRALQEGGLNDCIEAVPKVGYRFTAPVRQVADTAAETEPTGALQAERALAATAPAVDSTAVALPVAGRSHRMPWVAAALGAATIVVVATVWLTRTSEAPAGRPRIPTLAVLPFAMAPASDVDEYLGLGLADAVITQLSNLSQLQVRPTSSIRHTEREGGDAVAIGRQLQVDHVLDGLIQRDGERVRVTVQLIDVRTGAPRWADRLEERASDLFALQDRVAQHVAATLLERVTGTERERLMSRQSRNAEAYRAYLQGRAYLFRLRRSDVERSVPLLQQAVALDPGYALAHAALANAYRVLGGNLAGGRPSRPAEMVAMARKAALEALALDDTLADAHIVLGFTKLQWEWDFPGAGASMARAVALNPNSWETHNAHGWYLLAMGRFDEAIAAFRRARELDPVMPLVAEHLGQALAFSGRVEEGLAALREAVDLDPGAPRGHARLIVLLDSLDRPEEAMAARLRAATAIGQAGDAARMQETFRHGYQAVLRQELEARVAAGECLAAAQLHMALGEPARAVDRLEACVEQRHAWMPLLRVDLRFRSLHEDPRFLALLRRIGL